MTTVHTATSKGTCVRDSVAFMLRLPNMDVPDFVRSLTDGTFNENWTSDLSEWLSARGVDAIFLHRAEHGWGAPEHAFFQILSVIHDPVIAMVFRPGSDNGHALVVKIGQTRDEKSTYIVFDPDNPTAKPGSLMLGPGSQIRHYLVLNPQPKLCPWWLRLYRRAHVYTSRVRP